MVKFTDYIAEEKVKFIAGDYIVSIDYNMKPLKKVKLEPYGKYEHLFKTLDVYYDDEDEDDMLTDFIKNNNTNTVNILTQLAENGCFDNAFYMCSNIKNAEYVLGILTDKGINYLHAWNKIGKDHTDFTPTDGNSEQKNKGEYRVIKIFKGSEILATKRAYNKDSIAWIKSLTKNN